MANGTKVTLDLVTTAERFGLHHDESNERMAEVNRIFEIKQGKGNWNEFSVLLNLHLYDYQNNMFIRTDAWFSARSFNFKNGTEELGSTFEQHHTAWKRYAGQQVKVAFTIYDFRGEPIPNTNEQKITVNLNSLAILSVPLIGGEAQPLPYIVHAEQTEDPTPAPQSQPVAQQRPQPVAQPQQQHPQPTTPQAPRPRPAAGGFAPPSANRGF